MQFVPWLLFILALAFSPDAKLHRLKLLHLEWSLLAALIVWAWSGLRQGWTLRRTALDLPVAALGLAALAFHLLAPERSVSAIELQRLLLACSAFFIASQSPLPAPPREGGRRPGEGPGPSFLFAVSWSLLAATLSVLALYSRFTDPSSRAMATFGNPILLSSFMVPTVALSLGSGLGPWGYALAALQLAGLAATGTRASFLALSAAGLLALWIRGNKASNRLAGSLLLLGLAAGALLLLSRPITHGLIWRDTLRLWLDHPLFGCGLGRFHLEFPAYASAELLALWPQAAAVVNHAHNEFLQTLAETGLLGAALLLWLWATFAHTGVRHVPGTGFFWAAVTLWLQSFLSPDMRFGVSYVCVFVLMALAAPATREVHFHLSRGLSVAAASLITAASLVLGWSLQGSALGARALDEPSFFSSSEQVDAELQRWLGEAASRPQEPLAHEHLGYYYAKRQRFDEAIAAFRRSVALDPRRAGPHNNLGNVYYLQGRRDEAIRAWEQALRIDPRLADAEMNLGIAYYSQGKLKEASAHLENVLRIDPGNRKAKALLRRMAE